jgi:NMD protein affecting ribosome stability and mRNA decay
MKINANKFREVDFANFCTIRVLTSTKENDEKEKLMRNIFEKIISKCKKIERKDSEYSLKKYSYEKDGVIISFGETFDFK